MPIYNIQRILYNIIRRSARPGNLRYEIIGIFLRELLKVRGGNQTGGAYHHHHQHHFTTVPPRQPPLPPPLYPARNRHPFTQH